MNNFARDMMWITAGGFILMGLIACLVLGFSVAYAGLFILGLMFFVIGMIAKNSGLA